MTIAAARPIAERLDRLHPIGEAGFALVAGLENVAAIPAGAELRPQRERGPLAVFVLAGWVARVRWFEDGRRQFITLRLPSEGIGLYPHGPVRRGVHFVALTPVQLLDGSAINTALDAATGRRFAGLSMALRVAATLQDDYAAAHMLRLGRYTAYERMAHLLLEISERLAAADIGTGEQFPMPLTQEVLGDLMGLSIVHVNRTLQQLRRDGLIDLRGGQATLLDPEQLALVADYAPPSVGEQA